MIFWVKKQEYVLEPNPLPERIETLYQQGSFKIALEKKKDSNMLKEYRHKERKVVDANERQLALYKQGVAKIRQQRLSSSKSHQHESDPTDIHKKTVISKRTIRRQRSLYTLGVKKLRERNRKEVLVINQEEALKGRDNDYYKRLYQHLHSFVAKMENPVPFSETLSTEIEDSLPSRHETAFDAVTKGIAGIFSAFALDFPEIHNLRKTVTSVSTLSKEKKAVINLSKLCTMSNHLSHQSSTNTAMNKISESSRCPSILHHHHAGDADIDMDALKVGLRGIVTQYLLETVKENERSRILGKYDVTAEDSDVESVESSNCLVLELVSESIEDGDPMNTSLSTPRTITASESFSGNLLCSYLVSCDKSLHESASSSRSCNGCSSHSHIAGDGGIEMMLENDDTQTRDAIPSNYQYSEIEFQGGREDPEESSFRRTVVCEDDTNHPQREKKRMSRSRHVVIRKTMNDEGEIELCIL
jgi:hypothetical protein